MRIVAFAYACEPKKGSEPGAGWALAQMLASFAEVHVITRTNNRSAIEAAGLDEDVRITFSYVEGPRWARKIKSGQRGIRLYHSLWQLAALREARKIHALQPFDVAWHLTIANAWLGSAGGRLGIPFVFGPVGGGVTAPWKLVRSLGWRASMFEFVRVINRALWSTFNPLARSALKRATVVIAQNNETRKWLPARYQSKTVVFQNAVMEGDPPPFETRPHSAPVACFAGRINTWKGCLLAIRSIARTDNWRLLVLGEGPIEDSAKSLAEKLGISERVEFRGRVPHEELFATLVEESDVFLFPSLHDDSALVVAEAVSCGLPVVCLDIGGSPVIAGPRAIAIDPRLDPEEVVTRLSLALEEARELGRSTEPARSVSLPARAAALRALILPLLISSDQAIPHPSNPSSM